ncbi:predicted protein [Histoplasma mississippiense (nom. inval.)]|uniref:predicted protein n=1 Tax=Ajellomyces capsulatus (strain NAm1 / WU24) TaxID=2059318 RepID=UPI000157B2AE|nr:predicted protein [Histoplasma mississippiense (nom. inval.)]EDN02279.1 predicted protein [Histoplasma mississippiense (nom. inval.)]
MAPRRKPNIRKVGPQPSVRHGQGKRPRGIEKDQVQKLVRKSVCLEQLQDRAVSKDRRTEQRQPSPSSASNLPIKPLQKAQTFPQDRNQNGNSHKKSKIDFKIQNEAKVIMDIGQLIVPSAETLALYGATNLDILIEGFNEAWNKCIPFYGPCPQPDYCVGFRQSAFTHGQLEKLQPFIGSWTHTSLLMATDTMYFPFLACEVKCGEVALEVADRQNAHSMTVAVRVRIYGHYALVKEKQTTFYRRPIRKFDFTEQDGKERWTAYKFTRNIYDIWIPTHLKRIHSAVGQIPPGLDLDVSQAGLQFSRRSNAESFEDDDRQSSFIGSADITPSTSFTQVPEQPPKQFKKPRKK